jgi:hypothetical protein
MDHIIHTRSTSLHSAQGDEILLRETSNTRLAFRPMLVDNPHNPAASLKGTFIFQRKKPTNVWEDYKILDLTNLRASEWIQLELKSEELRTLFVQLDSYYNLHKQYGIQPGSHDFIVTPGNTKEVILSFLRNPENFAKLQDLQVEDLKQLTVVANLNSLKRVLRTWKDHVRNSDEDFWQQFLKQYSWVIAQVFASPVVLFKDKAYVGGKTISNIGGNIADFLFKSQFTDNVLIVEIKTPVTPLLGPEYRHGAFQLSAEVNGSVSQILKYKHELQKNYADLKDADSFTAFDPSCLVLVGNSSELRSEDRRRSFTLLRNDSRNVSIVTYDELFDKVALLIRLIED